MSFIDQECSWEELEYAARQMIIAFEGKKASIACAESCTGGLLSAIITEIAGASSVFYGGVVSYTNEAKIDILNVPPSVIETYGAVSRECAEKMALGALSKFKTTHAVSITGIAGPGGGSIEKPVGTVYLGIATHAGFLETYHCLLREKTRRQIRMASAKEALRLLSASLGSWQITNSSTAL